MEEMLKKIENIINNYNFEKKIEIVEYICKNFYLTQSEIREIFQILYDMSSAKKENVNNSALSFVIFSNKVGSTAGSSFSKF